jgi:uncharacterized protein YuzE
MQITYDKKTDCKYIAFQKRKRGIVARTEQLADWLMVDYAKDGSVYGVEILDASTHPGALVTVANQVLFATSKNQEDSRVNAVITNPKTGLLREAFSDAAYA